MKLKKIAINSTIVGCFFVFAVVPYFYVISGEYLYDDNPFINYNAELLEIRSLWDAFFLHQFQPTKPVHNFFLAAAYYMGKGSTISQRVFSLALHFLVVCVFYFVLLGGVEKAKNRAIAFWSCILFAVLPIHSETIVIAQFRGELLGSLFALLSILILRRLIYFQGGSFLKALTYLGLFASIGLSQLSKEFFVFALLILLPFEHYRITGCFRSRVSLASIFSSLFWASYIFLAYQTDLNQTYNYQETIGMGALPESLHPWLAARSLFEGMYQVLVGTGLSFNLRIVEIKGFGYYWSYWESVALLCCVVAILLLLLRNLKSRRIFIIWSALFSFYLFIPNINMGAAHYLYFPLLGLTALIVSLLDAALRSASKHSKFLLGSCICLYGLILMSQLVSRTLEIRTRYSAAKIDWLRHPDNVVSWINLADSQTGIEDPKTIWSTIQTGKKLFPQYSDRFIGLEASYHYLMKDRKSLGSALIALREVGISPKVEAIHTAHLSVLEQSEGRTEQAISLLDRALALDPVNAVYQNMRNSLIVDNSLGCLPPETAVN